MCAHILITRPREDAGVTAGLLEDLGHEVFTEPLLEIVPVGPTVAFDPVRDQGLIFTSASAVRIFAADNPERDIPVYTVGRTTAQVAGKSGYGDVHNAGRDADTLVKMIAGAGLPKDKPFHYPCGEFMARPVDAMLAEQGYTVSRSVVYTSQKAENLSDGCLSLLQAGSFDAALFFSARTGETFTRLVGDSKCQESVSGINALCLSERVVKSLSSLPWRQVYVAGHPDRDGMIELVQETFG